MRVHAVRKVRRNPQIREMLAITLNINMADLSFFKMITGRIILFSRRDEDVCLESTSRGRILRQKAIPSDHLNQLRNNVKALHALVY